jgi:hypothetical protein
MAVLLVLPSAVQASSLSRSSASANAAREPLLVTRDSRSTSRLFYVDPVSLRPLAATSLSLNFHWGDFAYSPDGSLLALSRNDAPELRFVRLGRLQLAGAIRFSNGNFVHPVAWLSQHMLLALLESSPAQVLAIDPSTRKVIWQQPIGGTALHVERSPNGLVVLAAPADTIGPATIAAIGADGSVRSVVIDQVSAGFLHNEGSSNPVGKIRSPGLAVDAAGSYAYVVGAGEPIAQVDLASMSVTYHGGLRSLAKAVSGPRREATWLGNGLLAVAGTESSIRTDSHGDPQQSTTPSGLLLLDTRTWASRVLQTNASRAIAVGDSLLAYTSNYDSTTSDRGGSGLTIYRLDGTLALHLLDQEPISYVQAQRDLAYVWLPDRNGHLLVVDPTSGRTLASVTKPRLTLLVRP